MNFHPNVAILRDMIDHEIALFAQGAMTHPVLFRDRVSSLMTPIARGGTEADQDAVLEEMGRLSQAILVAFGREKLH